MENGNPTPLKNTKICFIAGTLGMGGAERQLYIILSTAKKLGADVHLVSLTSGEFWEKPVKDLGIAYHTLNGKGNKASRILKIITLMRQIRPDIIHSQHFYTNLYAGVAAWFCGAKSIGSSRSELEMEIALNGRFGKASVKLPDYLVANSQKSAELAMAIRKNQSNVFYLPNALDLIKFSPAPDTGSAKEDISLLAIGSLIRLKRFDIFINLIEKLRQVYGDQVKGTLIGDGVLAPELKSIVEKYGLPAGAFQFVPRTPVPEDYMRKADFLIMSSEFEGTPNVVLEAMACGLPVVATRVGSLPYFMKDRENGFYYDGSPDHLQAILTELINNRAEASTAAANARATIEAFFSPDALERNITHIYHQILNN